MQLQAWTIKKPDDDGTQRYTGHSNCLGQMGTSIAQPTVSSSLRFSIHRLPHPRCWIEVCSQLPPEVCLSRRTFEQLWALHPAARGQVMMYGKVVETPRWQHSYVHDYRFSGLNHVGLPIPHPFLDRVLDWVFQDNGGSPAQQLLINWYDGGTMYIDQHSDDESQLVPGAPIYSFSYGAERRFLIHDKSAREGGGGSKVAELPLRNNTLLKMCGETQRHYKHSVPKQLRCKERRINVTVRLFQCCQTAFDRVCLHLEPLLAIRGLRQLVGRYAGCPSLTMMTRH